ncbi:MAG: right-handed parallel beta-helix repeat-containing protein [Phycisphaerae bacterium]|nr:right-handed parallel beta-helix repeat-containing protein [Phycisphaerae bacterium]
MKLHNSCLIVFVGMLHLLSLTANSMANDVNCSSDVKQADPVKGNIHIIPEADTYVRSGPFADTNYGSAMVLNTVNSDNSQMEVLIRFDLPKTRIAPDNAFIWINTTSDQTAPVENAAYLVTDDTWLENTVTWNNKPACNQELDAWVTDNDHSIKIDVTNQVREALRGDGRLSIMIKSPHNIGSDGQSVYYSKESSSGLSPKLLMSFNRPKTYVKPGQSIQQAINAIHSQGGGQVILQSGQHFINDSLTLYSNITLQGQSKESTSICMDTSVNKPMLIGTSEGTVNSDITILELTLNGLLDQTEQHYPSSTDRKTIRGNVFGILFTDTDSGNTFKRIQFKNVGVTRCSMGIHIKGVNDLRISNSEIAHNGSIIAYDHNIYFRRANNALLKNLNISNCTAGNGFNLSTNCKNVILDNCDASDNNFRGIRFDANDGGSRMMVINCITNRNGQTEGQPGVRIAGVPDFTLLGCTANNNGSFGFYFLGSRRGVIKENSAVENADTDLYLKSCSTVEVVNNTAETFLAESCSDITKTGNIF